MSIDPNFAPSPNRRVPTDDEVRHAMARGRRLQARAVVGYFTTLGQRFRGNPNGR